MGSAPASLTPVINKRSSYGGQAYCMIYGASSSEVFIGGYINEGTTAFGSTTLKPNMVAARYDPTLTSNPFTWVSGYQ